jgi:Ribbon-helix-helix protein, copG family
VVSLSSHSAWHLLAPTTHINREFDTFSDVDGGGTIYGMNKTTIYLPDELKDAVAREARHRGVAEAQVIREAIAAAVRRPVPRGGLFESDILLADRADELLAGFGER